MGVLNVTPDSFSDGGEHLGPEVAVEAARQMVAEGADLIDIGAESTKPGAARVSTSEQIARLRPVLERLSREDFPLPITVDTTLSPVAAMALDLGVAGVNDISAGREDPDLLRITAKAGAAIVLMHMQGTPATMQINPRYTDVVVEVTDFLSERVRAAHDAGIAEELVIADPGIGFGKTVAHNLLLLRGLPEIWGRLGVPLLVGTSRKGFLGKITGRPDARDRLHATTASVAWAAANGAAIVRVHDVAAVRDTVRVTHAIATGTWDG